MPHPFARCRARAYRLAASAAALAFVALPAALISGPATAADWPMFLLNPAHNAISPEALDAPMALQWRFQTARYANNPVSPIIVDKTLYLASQSNVFALDAETGEQKWVYPAQGPIGTPSTATIKATPVVDDGTLFVGASDGVLYAIDTETGRLRWQFDARGNIRFSPIVVDNVVYFGSDDYRVYGINAKTGEPAMEPFKTGNNIIGSPAYSDGVLYFNSADLNFYAYNLSTHRLRFNLRMTNASAYASPVVTDTNLFTVGGSTLYCLMRNGSIRWQFMARNPITTTPLVTDEGIYFGDRGGQFYALDHRGRSMWTIRDNATRAMRFSDRPVAATDTEDTFLRLGGAIYSSPVLTGKNIIVGTNRGFLYAIDPETGKIRWEYGVYSNLPAGTYPNITAAPAVANGRLYVTSDDGALLSFSPAALDAEKPMISSEVPVRATLLNGTPPITLGAVVGDEGSGIDASSIKITLDGEPVEHQYQANTGWVYYRTRVTQPIQPLAEGRHEVTLTVSDWRGNTATSTWSFVVDNSLATSVISTPAGTLP